MYKHSLTKSFLYPLIFPWRIEKCLPRLVILMTLWWWHFLAMLETTQKVSRIARYLGCVGRSDLLRALQALKTKLLLRGRPGAAPSPRPSAALTHQSFVNIRARLFHRGKVKAQFPCLTYITKSFLLPLIFPWKIEKCMPISEISHQDWC